MYDANIIADSISPDGVRLTTFEITFPRFILAEVNTHRVFSRNSASSRAIPTEKIIKRVKDNPFVPETFNKRVKGMGVGDAVVDDHQKASRDAWLWARDKSVQAAELLLDMDIDKSRVNRLLEPFMWHTAIITATEWRNFYSLRTDKAAQPEFVIIASEMLELHKQSEPTLLQKGQWHLPLVDRDEVHDYTQYDKEGGYDTLKKLSAGRCARVSYDRHTDSEPEENTLARTEKLITSGHMSPTEHQARPLQNGDVVLYTKTIKEQDIFGPTLPEKAWSGNLRGWHQFRKEIPNESDFSRTWGEDPYGF